MPGKTSHLCRATYSGVGRTDIPEANVVALSFRDTIAPRSELSARPLKAMTGMPPLSGRQSMQGVVFLVGCGDDDDFEVKLAENGAFYPREPSGVNVFDGFQEHGRVNSALGPVAVLERAETHVQAFVAAEEVEVKPRAGKGQCPGIDVYTQQPDKLVVVAEPLQQLSATTAEISDMSDPRSKQGFNNSIQAGAMQNRRHYQINLQEPFMTGIIAVSGVRANRFELNRIRTRGKMRRPVHSLIRSESP